MWGIRLRLSGVDLTADTMCLFVELNWQTRNFILEKSEELKDTSVVWVYEFVVVFCRYHWNGILRRCNVYYFLSWQEMKM